MGALSRLCNVSTAAMTGLRDNLAKRGLVEQVSHPSDRRAIMIGITEKGIAMILGAYADSAKEDAP